jgi:hypothetical protein
MRTMDNRHIMDVDMLKRTGIQVETPQFVEAPQA